MRHQLEPATRCIVHVVDVRLDDPRLTVDDLDATERGRAAGFARPADRRRFVAAHSAKRRVRGRCLQMPPRSLRFASSAYGKPHLVDPPFDIRFNLSHAGDRALLAIAMGREIGVDIEQHRPVDVITPGEIVSSSREREAVVLASSTGMLEAFYRTVGDVNGRQRE